MTRADRGGQQQPYPPQQGGQYQPPPGYELTKKKRKKWPFILGALVLLIVIIVAANSGGRSPGSSGGSNPAAPEASGDTATVVYEVLGAKSANNITYSADGGGGISQENGAQLPWKKEVKIERGFAITQVTAQNAGSGTITCRITVDGEVVKELSSQGQYAVVSCTGEPIT